MRVRKIDPIHAPDISPIHLLEETSAILRKTKKEIEELFENGFFNNFFWYQGSQPFTNKKLLSELFTTKAKESIR